MRVHRIRLANFRGVIESEVRFADTGVTIVEGPNEVGKSSLAEAMSLVIEELDSSTKEKVRAVRPVHRDEGTEVELELTTGPYHFVIRKRWFKGRGIWLDVLAPSRQQLTGREAHERMLAMIGETADRPLWDALRLDQGREVSQSVLATRSVLKALDAVAGGSPDDSSDGTDLWQRVEAEWSAYFTPTGQPKGERKHLESHVAHAQEELDRLDAELGALESKTDRVATLAAQLQRLDTDCLRAAAQLADLDDAWNALAGAVSEVEKLALARQAAQLEHQHRRSLVDHRLGLVAEVDRLAARRAQLDADHDARAHDASEHDGARAAAADGLAAARAALAAAEALHAARSANAEHARRIFDHKLLSERHARVVANTSKLVALHKELEQVIDEDVVADIEAADTEVVKARAVVEAGAGSFQIEALAGITVELPGEELVLEAGSALTRHLTDASTITIPGVARVSVMPGAGALQGAARLADAEVALAQLCATAGVADLAEAAARLKAHDQALLATAEAEERLRNDLRDLTPELMLAKIEGLTDQIDRFVAAHPEAGRATPTLDDAEVEVAAAAAERDACRRALEAALATNDGLTAATEGRMVEVAERGARRDAARDAAERASAELADARAEHPDEELVADLLRAETDLAEAVARHDAAAADLRAHDPDSVKARRDNAGDLVERLAVEKNHVALERTELQAFLKGRGEDGLHQLRSEARAALERARHDLDRDARRAAAADLLHCSFAARREAARQRYVAPFRERIERLGRIVYGPSFEVELDAELRVGRRTLHGVSLDVKDLSAGAKEQLAILSRLACAATVSADGGAPVIFDDTMGWTDPERLAAMGAAIATAGRECQVIILTCVPGRFAAVGNATTHRLHAVTGA